jgi:lipase chaperone LimK
VPKLQVSQIFRRVSPNNHDLTFDQFKEMIEKLFAEVNRLKGHDLKKRLKRGGGMTEEETTEAKQQMHDIKNKTREEVIEEAYTYLELDNL